MSNLVQLAQPGAQVFASPLDQKDVVRICRRDRRFTGKASQAAAVFAEIVEHIHSGVGTGAKPWRRGKAWASNRYLAELTGLAPRTIRYCLEALIRHGYVKLAEKEGRLRMLEVFWPLPESSETPPKPARSTSDWPFKAPPQCHAGRHPGASDHGTGVPPISLKDRDEQIAPKALTENQTDSQHRSTHARIDSIDAHGFSDLEEERQPPSSEAAARPQVALRESEGSESAPSSEAHQEKNQQTGVWPRDEDEIELFTREYLAAPTPADLICDFIRDGLWKEDPASPAWVQARARLDATIAREKEDRIAAACADWPRAPGPDDDDADLREHWAG
jgi:hypothetical protein